MGVLLSGVSSSARRILWWTCSDEQTRLDRHREPWHPPHIPESEARSRLYSATLVGQFCPPSTDARHASAD